MDYIILDLFVTWYLSLGKKDSQETMVSTSKKQWWLGGCAADLEAKEGLHYYTTGLQEHAVLWMQTLRQNLTRTPRLWLQEAECTWCRRYHCKYNMGRTDAFARNKWECPQTRLSAPLRKQSKFAYIFHTACNTPFSSTWLHELSAEFSLAAVFICGKHSKEVE